MIKWQPKFPQRLTLDKFQARTEFNKKRTILLCIGFCGVGGMLVVSRFPFLLPVLFGFIFLVFTIFYLRFRSFFQSYLYTYGDGRDKYYCEDYSWKDSLAIGLLLIL